MPSRSTARRAAGLCLLVGVLAWPGVSAWAQAAPARTAAPADGRPWNSLTPAQQAALRPLQPEWNSIDPVRKGKWLQIADRLPTLPPAERERIQTRMSDWARMTPEQRGQARLNYRQAQQTPAESRRARWEAYQSLTPEQQKDLAARGAPASAPSRKAPDAKSTLVPNPSRVARPSVVAPSVTQAGPGATTNLVTKRAVPPSYQQPGLPKIATGPALVDGKTLQPRRGAQAAGTRPPAPSGPAVVPRP